jgi:hypothetical protein
MFAIKKKNCRIEACSFSRPSLFYFIYFSLIKIIFLHGFAPGFVNYKKGALDSQKYQLLAHGRWFSPGTPASSTTKTGRHDLAEILLKVVLNTLNQINQFK